MSWTFHIALYFLGLQFILFGLDGFFHFIPVPKPVEGIENFIQALEKTKYLMPSIKLLEIGSGILCLLPQYQILALFLLAPIIFNIVGIHLVFNRKKSWIILIQVLMPYALGVVGHQERILSIFF